MMTLVSISLRMSSSAAAMQHLYLRQDVRLVLGDRGHAARDVHAPTRGLELDEVLDGNVHWMSGAGWGS